MKYNNTVTEAVIADYILSLSWKVSECAYSSLNESATVNARGD
jgi:hypothetical protein